MFNKSILLGRKIAKVKFALLLVLAALLISFGVKSRIQPDRNFSTVVKSAVCVPYATRYGNLQQSCNIVVTIDGVDHTLETRDKKYSEGDSVIVHAVGNNFAMGKQDNLKTGLYMILGGFFSAILGGGWYYLVNKYEGLAAAVGAKFVWGFA